MLRRSFKAIFEPSVRQFSSKNVVSVDAKRAAVKESQVESVKEPSLLPNSDFLYDYRPMAISEEVISKQRGLNLPFINTHL